MLLTPFAKLVTGALLAGVSATCPAPAQPDPLPNCTTDVTIVTEAYYEDEGTGCNLTPPQMLVIILPDASDTYMLYCDDAGGQVLIRPTEVLCLGADY